MGRVQDKVVIVTGAGRGIGEADVLVNNAGVIHLGDPVNFDLDEWRHMSSVNIEGTMLGMKTCD